MDSRLIQERFPRASRYNPDWLLSSLSGGANSLWLAEWLAEAVELKPGMRVLDLGCGRAASSIFFRREFGVQVWAVDLWFHPSENHQRICDAGVQDSVFPLRGDARHLPFAREFFDAIVSIDSFFYYGTDDLYLNGLASLLKPGGQLGMAGAAMLREIGETIPEHLLAWWNQDRPWCLHSAEWWRRHWGRTGILDIEVADHLVNGWTYWREWLQFVSPQNQVELDALNADQGQYFGYARVVGRRRHDAPLHDDGPTIPVNYVAQPLLRGD